MTIAQRAGIESSVLVHVNQIMADVMPMKLNRM